MFEGLNPFSKKEAKNTLKSEHLKEGVRPIMACIFDEENPSEKRAFEALDKEHALPVDYFFSDELMREKGLTNAGEKTYVISPSNEQDKFSYGYKDCTGVIAVGRSKESGKEISFMSHEDPQEFLKDVKSKFMVDLEHKIAGLKALSEEGTMDVVIFGGNYFENTSHVERYLDSIELLNKMIKQGLGFSPVVLTGPNVVGGNQAIYLETQKRRIHILKPEDLARTNLPYVASQAGKQKQEWKRASGSASHRFLPEDF